MIVTIQSANQNDNGYIPLCCSIASMGALVKRNTTCVLQLMNTTKDNVENTLMGKELSSVISDGHYTTFSNEGMDSLFRVIDSNKLNEEHYASYCMDVFKTPKLLSLAKVTSKATFIEELSARKESVSNLLENTQEIYQNVIVAVANDDPELIDLVNQKADVSIFCMSQGDETVVLSGKNPKVVITDYDSSSSFNIKSMGKHIPLKKQSIYKVERCIGYTDSVKRKNLVEFVSSNKENEPGDVNYWWNKDVLDLVNLIYGEEKSCIDEEPFLNYQYDEEMEAPETMQDVIQIQINEVQKRKGLFKKKKEEQVVLIPGDFSSCEYPEEETGEIDDVEIQNMETQGETELMQNETPAESTEQWGTTTTVAESKLEADIRDFVKKVDSEEN